MPESRGTSGVGVNGFAAAGGRLSTFVAFLILGALVIMPGQAFAAGTISVLPTGPGAGAITSNPGSIDCAIDEGGVVSGTCIDATFADSSTVTITAIPADAESVFGGWTVGAGSCTGPTNPCTITIGFFGGSFSLAGQFIKTPDLPSVVTEAAEPGPNEDLLSLRGTVNPNGFEVNGCRFEYGPTTEYGTGVPCAPGASELGEGEAPIEVSAFAELEQLEPDTTYHYRLVASNLGGEAQGEDRTFTTAGAPAGSCSNAEIRDTQPFAAIMLPDCMALELASPPLKDSQPARNPSLTNDGEAVQYESLAALADTPGSLNPTTGDFYVAARDSSGWSTAYTAPPAGIVNGWNGEGRAQSFTPDFECWLLIGSTQQQVQQGIGRAFKGCKGGVFEPLSSLLAPTAGGVEGTATGASLKGVSADLSHLYFWPGEADTVYLGNDPVPAGTSDRNAYVAHLDPSGDPALELAARDSDGKVWGGKCGTHVGGTENARPTGRNLGAVSADGTRSYISTRPSQPAEDICRTAINKLRIMRRTETVEGSETGVEIEELFASECDRVSPACSAADGDDFYEAASVDQSKVYFTTNRQLADSDLDGSATQCSPSVAVEGCDLYLYDADAPAGERLRQVSAGGSGDPDPGVGAKVFKNITAVSTDGSRAYFVAQGLLTTDLNPEGDEAEAGEANLYAYEAEEDEVSFVGILDAGDTPGLWGRAGGFVNNAYPVPSTDGSTANPSGGDGHVLAFIAKASLASNDADGGRRDVYRYDSEAEALQCVSCVGAADAEPFDVSSRDIGGRVSSGNDSGTDFAQFRRWAGDGGDSITLKTDEGLRPGDANGVNDSYLWHKGQLRRLPGTTDPNRKLEDIPTISADGSTVAFQSFAQLLPFDRDTAIDVYVARTGGGFAVPEPTPPICEGEVECQGDPGVPPAAAGLLTDSPGLGNSVLDQIKCSSPARRAQKLSRKAKRLRRQARRIDNPGRSKGLRRKARRLSRRAQGLSKNAKRCRRANRRAGK